ncbi:protein of unknown function [Nitratireductor aquimarinus]
MIFPYFLGARTSAHLYPPASPEFDLSLLDLNRERFPRPYSAGGALSYRNFRLNYNLKT